MTVINTLQMWGIKIKGNIIIKCAFSGLLKIMVAVGVSDMSKYDLIWSEAKWTQGLPGDLNAQVTTMFRTKPPNVCCN